MSHKFVLAEKDLEYIVSTSLVTSLISALVSLVEILTQEGRGNTSAMTTMPFFDAV